MISVTVSMLLDVEPSVAEEPVSADQSTLQTDDSGTLRQLTVLI